MKHSLIPLCGLLTLPVASLAQERPNIIVILVDDLGYGDLSCQGFAKDLHTPNIDKLLNEGIRCTNFHANCPVSSPTRASMLTGRFPDMVGVPGVIRTDIDDSWGYLSQEARLLPQMLQQTGYKTAAIGKWHLGLEVPNTPTERGFDYFKGFLGDMMDDYYTHLRQGNNYMVENDREINPKGHATDLFADWAIDYLSERKGEVNPFFLYLAFNAPHGPIQPPKDWQEKIAAREAGTDITELRTRMVALTEHLDYNIGRVYEALEANGQLENTLIVFTSDNGGDQWSDANNGNLRGFKQNMYEGGIAVPGGFYWKGKIEPTVNDNFMMVSDIFPTLCDLTDVEIKHEIDGISVLPILKGEEQVTDDRMVFWVRREGNMNYGGQVYYAARYKNYKLVQNTPFEAVEMFDLDADPMEQSPITDKKDPMFQKLFMGLAEHIRLAGSIPWQAPNN